MGNFKQALTVGQRTDFYTDDSRSVQDFLKEIRKIKPMSAEEEKELFCRYRAGDAAARKRIIESYQLFVYAAARQHADEDNLLDLVNVGNIGLMEALERFDVDSGNRFISFAVFYIKKHICYDLQINSGIVKNIYYNRARKKTIEASDAFYAINGREPTEDELWDILSSSTKRILQKKENIHGNKCLSISETLDSGTTFESSPEFNMATAGESEQAIYAQFKASDDRAVVDELMVSLGKMEREVVKRLYGIGYPQETESEVSMRLGISVKQVESLKRTAIGRMRQATRKNSCTRVR